MVATLARSGSTFITANQRSFDAWGGIRGGAQSGAPKGRYCAQLGHVQDDESGLIYMRARYYEPRTGRFVSADPDCQGANWHVYGADDPVDKCDASGRSSQEFAEFLLGLALFIYGYFALGCCGDLNCGAIFSAERRMEQWIDMALIKIGNTEGSEILGMLRDARAAAESCSKLSNTLGMVKAGVALSGYIALISSVLLDIDFAGGSSGYDILQTGVMLTSGSH